METCFTRKNEQTISNINLRIREMDSIIHNATKQRENLENKKRDAEVEKFMGHTISWEDDRYGGYGRNYELSIKLPENVQIKAKVHPNAHEQEGERTFIASLEFNNYYYGENEFYRRFKSMQKRNIEQFDDAKHTCLTYLKDFIDSLNEECSPQQMTTPKPSTP